ncbi:hypothetical protein Tco_0806063 [Tanacetum coccineum]
MIFTKDDVVTDCLPTPTTLKSWKDGRKETEVPQDETHHDDSVPIPSNDLLLSGEDRMQPIELMILCTNLQKQVLNLEKVKDAQEKEIADFKGKRWKKDESSSKKAEITQDSSAKRAGDKLESDKSKKQKTDENEEVEVDNEAELKSIW